MVSRKRKYAAVSAVLLLLCCNSLQIYHFSLCIQFFFFLNFWWIAVLVLCFSSLLPAAAAFVADHFCCNSILAHKTHFALAIQSFPCVFIVVVVVVALVGCSYCHFSLLQMRIQMLVCVCGCLCCHLALINATVIIVIVFAVVVVRLWLVLCQIFIVRLLNIATHSNFAFFFFLSACLPLCYRVYMCVSVDVAVASFPTLSSQFCCGFTYALFRYSFSSDILNWVYYCADKTLF